MFMRMIYDDHLAAASYLIGCQRTGEAIVIDPERDVDRYIDLAAREGLRIVAVTETHIHADFLSGSRELAERTGARVYVSDEGDADWKYGWLDQKSGGGAYDHRLLRDGDRFSIGNIDFRVLHTPGHTPEHIALLVTDRGGGATEPIGLASGDFVFVGDLGRPDLLETAAGSAGAADPSARRLFASVRKLAEIPEFVQVWPAHGAGSACGKALGAVPMSTIGYERRFNPAILAATSEARFVDYILAGQPEPPLYFARMKRDNKRGPRILGKLPSPRRLSTADLKALDTKAVALVDTRSWAAFRAGHLPGSLFHPVNSAFVTDVGSMVGENEEIVLIVTEGQLETAIRDLVRIGLDRVAGWAAPEQIDELRSLGVRLAETPEIDVAAARRRGDEFAVLDVRRGAEYAEGHIAGSLNIAHTRLAAQLDRVPRDRPLLVQCRSGGRSARACALLERRGYRVANLAGGMLAWEAAGAPVERGSR
ncbi:MAG: MBL fold metallo-hydrolase [Phycisphaerales bacterium]|nr:MBL fold metallo-hydrolase [Phycisphaerales bacterium]